ncbi:MAG: hypothetical protein WDN69_09970 [Aliidongia sp.]
MPDFKIGLPAYNPNILHSNPIPLTLTAVDPLAEASSEIKAVGDALQDSEVAGAASGADQIIEGGPAVGGRGCRGSKRCGRNRAVVADSAKRPKWCCLPSSRC